MLRYDGIKEYCVQGLKEFLSIRGQGMFGAVVRSDVGIEGRRQIMNDYEEFEFCFVGDWELLKDF